MSERAVITEIRTKIDGISKYNVWATGDMARRVYDAFPEIVDGELILFGQDFERGGVRRKVVDVDNCPTGRIIGDRALFQAARFYAIGRFGEENVENRTRHTSIELDINAAPEVPASS